MNKTKDSNGSFLIFSTKPNVLFWVLGAFIYLSNFILYTKVILSSNLFYIVFAFRVLSIIALILALLRWFVEHYVRKKQQPNKTKIRLVLISILSTFFLAEIGFMFVSQSHGIGFTMAHQLWMKKHWNPINKAGYRDDEITNNKKKKLLILGDSFTAGDGIEDYRKTFGNILEDKLNGEYDVINAGKRGADSRAEMINFQELNMVPNKIILQYYGNDIEGAAKRAGIKNRRLNTAAKLFHLLVLKPSALLQYTLVNLTTAKGKNGRKYLRKSYVSKPALNYHFGDLIQLVNYCKQNNIELAVVMFPFLSNMEDSKMYLPIMRKFFNEYNVPTINLIQVLYSLPEGQRIVNKKNHHPSEAVHELVANEIFSFMVGEKWTSTSAKNNAN